MGVIRDYWDTIVEYLTEYRTPLIAVFIIAPLLGALGVSWFLVVQASDKHACQQRRTLGMVCNHYVWDEEGGECIVDPLPDGPCSDPCMKTCSCTNGRAKGEERDCVLPEDPCRQRWCESSASQWECKDVHYGTGELAYKENGSRCVGTDGQKGACAHGLCIGEDGRVIAPLPSSWKKTKEK